MCADADGVRQKQLFWGASLAFLVPRLQQSRVWKLQLFLDCAVRNAKEDSVSVLGPEH